MCLSRLSTDRVDNLFWSCASPTFTTSGIADTHGLTISGLSGGAVTLSGITTTGTTTTATLSRSVGSTETGGTLYGTVGAFSDSASSPSLCAAFRISLSVQSTPTPTNLAATGGLARVGLTWTGIAGNATYSLYRSTATGAETLYRSGLTVTSFADTSLTGGTYFYKVTATIAGSESAPSSEVSATVSDFSLSASPTTITVPAGGVAVPASITVNPIGGFSGTVTFPRVFTASGLSATAAGSASPGTPVSIAIAADASVPSGVYPLTITGTDATGAVSRKATISVTVQSPIPNPLTAVGGLTRINLTWGSVAGNPTYSIYRSTTSGAETAYKPGLMGTSFSDTGLPGGTTYFYKVTATNSGVESTPSNEASATVTDFTLSKPSTVTVPAGGSASTSMTVNPIGGFSGAVSFGGGASGISLSGTAQAPSSPATLQVSVAGSAAPGTYSLTVTGTGSDATGSVSHTTPITVIVTPPLAVHVIWTSDATTSPVTQTASTSGQFGGNASVHLSLPLPPGATSAVATSVTVHEAATPDASHDITATNLPFNGSANPLCDPPPGLPAGWTAAYADVVWPLGGRCGPYSITTSVQYVTAGGGTVLQTQVLTADREDLLIISTSLSSSGSAGSSDPAPFVWGNGLPSQTISATIHAAYKSVQPVVVTIRDSDQNVIQTMTQSFAVGSGSMPVSLLWSGSSTTLNPSTGTYVAPLGVYQYQIEVGSPGADYDNSRSSLLRITSTSADLTNSDATNYYFSYSYTLQDTGGVAAKSGQIYVYNPDMQKIQTFDLSTQPDANSGGLLTALQASSTGTAHTVNLILPISAITFGGDYRFYLHLVDGHAAGYKGANSTAAITTEEKSAIDKNGRKTISGPITYISSGSWRVAWAVQNRGARRVTILESPAQVHAPLNWVNPLLTGFSHAFVGGRTEQQIQAAVNGTFFPYTVYDSNDAKAVGCPDPNNPVPWEPNFAHPSLGKHRALNTVVSGGEVGPSWMVGPSGTPPPDPIKHARWCFGMAATGASLQSLPMMMIKPATRTQPPLYAIDPKIKLFSYGLSNVGGLITTDPKTGATKYYNLTSDERGSFSGTGTERTAIGWTAAGDFFLVTNNSSDWNSVRDFFHNTLPTLAPRGYNIGPITNAFMLDGGGSTQFAYVNNFQDILGGYINLQHDDGSVRGDDRYMGSIVGLQWP